MTLVRHVLLWGARFNQYHLNVKPRFLFRRQVHLSYVVPWIDKHHVWFEGLWREKTGLAGNYKRDQKGIDTGDLALSQGWRIQTGRKMKPLYERYVELKNQGARLNNFTDAGDQWRSEYETETFEADIMSMYEELRPLYEELHAYVRRNLHNVYGEVGLHCANIPIFKL